jgi:hypothetical protein
VLAVDQEAALATGTGSDSAAAGPTWQVARKARRGPRRRRRLVVSQKAHVALTLTAL